MELLKLLSTSEIFAQIISFLILFLLLRAFAWKHILKALDDRKARISSEFKAIEDTKNELAVLKSECNLKLANIDEEARKKINSAIEEGKKITEELRKNAHLESQRIIEKARSDIKYELTKAKEELKEKIIDLTITTAGSVIQEKLTEEEDIKLVKDFINRAEEIK